MYPERSSISLLSIALALYGLSFWAYSPLDPDLGWHLLGGEWTVTHHWPPTFDFINAFGTVWHDYHWLAQSGLFAAYSVTGFPGVMVLLGLCCAALFVSLGVVSYVAVPRIWQGLPPLTPILLSVVGLTSIVSHRPQLVALLAIALTIALLCSHKANTARVVLLFVLTALTANIHVYWVFIPALWFLYMFRLRASAYFGYGILIASGALVSPYGLFGGQSSTLSVLANYLVLVDYLLIPNSLARQVLEFRSSLSDSGAPRWIVLVSIAAAARWGGKWCFKGRVGDTASYALGLCLAIAKVKFIGVFAVLSLPLHLRLVLKASRDFPSTSELVRRHATRVTRIVLVMLLAWCVSRYPSFSYEPEDLKAMYPIEACAVLGGRVGTEKRPIRVLTSFDHGGWCAWAIQHGALTEAPLVTVLADGRTQGREEEYFRALFDLFSLRGRWLSTLEEWRPDFAALSKDTPLAQFMALATHAWTIEFQDGNFVLFRARRDEPRPS